MDDIPKSFESYQTESSDVTLLTASHPVRFCIFRLYWSGVFNLLNPDHTPKKHRAVHSQLGYTLQNA